MKAAWYEQQGPARDVLVVGELPDPEPGSGEVRIRVVASGINPGDVKKRGDTFGVGMPYPRVIPHSDGAGIIDRVGGGVDSARTGERVWCYGAQSYRPFGTAAEIDEEVLAISGSIAAYATEDPMPVIPFWPLLFKNIRVFFLGSDDFPIDVKLAAAEGLNAALEAGWSGFEIGRRLPLAEIADAHEYVEEKQRTGRIVLEM